MPIATVLAEIDHWLAEHAPATLHALPAPATDQEIDAVSQAVRVNLDPDLKTLLRWHNGTGDAFPAFDLVPTFAFLGTEDIAKAATLLAGPFPTYLPWNDRWIPIGSDWCGAHLLVDHSDGPDRGRVMISDHEDPLNFWETWVSLPQALAATYAAMRDGTEFLGGRVSIIDGWLEWSDAG